MSDSKENGAKIGVQNMLYYYLSSIIETVEDPKQFIASEMGAMIDLSEEQIQYVKMNTSSNNKMLENLSSSIDLLVNIEKTKTLDLESIAIVRQILELMKKQCEDSLRKHTTLLEEEEDE